MFTVGPNPRSSGCVRLRASVDWYWGLMVRNWELLSSRLFVKSRDAVPPLRSLARMPELQVVVSVSISVAPASADPVRFLLLLSLLSSDSTGWKAERSLEISVATIRALNRSTLRSRLPSRAR